MNDFYAREFWRFVLVQQEVGKLAETAVDSRQCKHQPPSTLRRSNDKSTK